MAAIKFRQVVKAALTWAPGSSWLIDRKTGGSIDAGYCYSVWLRHLSMLSSIPGFRLPRVVAELGPGDSLGLGIAAMLTGVERYVGLDLVPFATSRANVDVFDGILELVTERAPIPWRSYPEVLPGLSSFDFPADVLDEAHLSRALDRDRVERIRDAVAHPDRSGLIEYHAPWTDPGVVQRASVDLVLSQAVLEHVADVNGTHRAIADWLRPGGFASHQIDFRSHSLSARWDGHLEASEPMWRFVSMHRRFLLNRQPLGAHLRGLDESRMEVEIVDRVRDESTVDRSTLNRVWGDWLPGDEETASAYVAARKRTPDVEPST